VPESPEHVCDARVSEERHDWQNAESGADGSGEWMGAYWSGGFFEWRCEY
jgi:hypothetical protein